MGLLGPTEAENAVTESAKSSLRADVAKKIALGGGWSVGAAIVFGAFELLHNDSKDAFPLLRAWGPWAILSIVAVYVLYDLAKIALSVLQRGVMAMERTAVALQKLGDKDDRSFQELQTLTAYTSQEADRNSAAIRAISDQVATLVKLMTDRTELDINEVVAKAIVAYKRVEAQGA